MSSVHADRGWLVIAFRLNVNGKWKQARIYPSIRDTREGRRSPVIKEIREMIQARRWSELAERFPTCKPLAPFRAENKEDTTTLRQAAERFLAYQANVNRPATVEFNRRILRVHVWPAALASKQLRLIGASDIASVVAGVHRSGREPQAANIRRVLSAVFNWAKGERGTDGAYLVADNPVTRTRPLSVKRRPDAVDPFTPEEIRQVVQAARVGWERRLVTVAIGSGLDPGENFGLKVADLDFADRLINVRQRFTRYGVGEPKNARRQRNVDMSGPVYQVLCEQRGEIELRSQWLWPMGAPWIKPHNPQNFSRRQWPAILSRAGVRRRPFYQCRHTFATLLLQSGADWQYVADQMGHSNLKMLVDVYWKWRPGGTRKPQKDLIAEAFTKR